MKHLNTSFHLKIYKKDLLCFFYQRVQKNLLHTEMINRVEVNCINVRRTEANVPYFQVKIRFRNFPSCRKTD